MLRLADQIKSQ